MQSGAQQEKGKEGLKKGNERRIFLELAIFKSDTTLALSLATEMEARIAFECGASC